MKELTRGLKYPFYTEGKFWTVHYGTTIEVGFVYEIESNKTGALLLDYKSPGPGITNIHRDDIKIRLAHYGPMPLVSALCPSCGKTRRVLYMGKDFNFGCHDCSKIVGGKRANNTGERRMAKNPAALKEYMARAHTLRQKKTALRVYLALAERLLKQVRQKYSKKINPTRFILPEPSR